MLILINIELFWVRYWIQSTITFFLIWNFDFGKNFIFGVDNSSSTHADNRRKDILVLGEGRTLGLDNSAITAKAKYFSNFTPSQNKFC